MGGWKQVCAEEGCDEDFVKGSVLMQVAYMPYITRHHDPAAAEDYLLHRPLGWLTPEAVRILDLASARVIQHSDSLPYRVGEPASDEDCVLPPKPSIRVPGRVNPAWIVDQGAVDKVGKA
jgi:hypothetical protein